MDDTKTYEIRRFYAEDGKPYKVMNTGLTLEEAQEWCNDPQSSNSVEGWFDGYTEE